MNTPICTVCRSRSCYYDSSRASYSPYCSNTCKQNGQTFVQKSQPMRAVQGQPICRMCYNAAFYDGTKYSPGCCKSHAQQAMSYGFYTPKP